MGPKEGLAETSDMRFAAAAEDVVSASPNITERVSSYGVKAGTNFHNSQIYIHSSHFCSGMRVLTDHARPAVERVVRFSHHEFTSVKIP